MASTTHLSTAEFKMAMNASDAELRQWRSEGMPRNADGTYNLKECQNWHLIGYWEQRNKSMSADSKNDVKKAIAKTKAEFVRARAYGMPKDIGCYLAGMALPQYLNGISTDQIIKHFKEVKKLW